MKIKILLSIAVLTISFNCLSQTISLIGPAALGWGTDVFMTTTNNINYTLASYTFTNGDIKFRQDSAWVFNWGWSSQPSFPIGNGTLSSFNIIVIAGTYSVTFNRITGAYAFAVLSTSTFAAAGFEVFPNPSNNIFNFTSKISPISSIQIVDMLGKVVLTRTANQNEVNVDASGLTSGVYFAKVTAADAIETVKLLKN